MERIAGPVPGTVPAASQRSLAATLAAVQPGVARAAGSRTLLAPS